MVKRLAAIVLLAGLLGACTAGLQVEGISAADRAAILGTSKHLLTFGPPTKAESDAHRTVYHMDSVALGEGAAGLKAVHEIIGEMPAGSSVELGTYISGENGDHYPFDVPELVGFAKKHAVAVLVPSAR